MSKNRYRFVEKLVKETYSYDEDIRWYFKRIQTSHSDPTYHTLFSTDIEPKTIQLGSTIMFQGHPYQVVDIIEDVYLEEVIYVTNKEVTVEIDYKSKAEAYEEYANDLKEKLEKLIGERRELGYKLTKIQEGKGYRFFKKLGFIKG